MPRAKFAALYATYINFEKQYGTRSTLENTVLRNRRIHYKDEITHDSRNYDVWFDYARLEEGALRDLREEGATPEELDGSIGRVREVYEGLSHRFLQVAKRGIGDDIYFFDWIMRCSRKSKSKYALSSVFCDRIY